MRHLLFSIFILSSCSNLKDEESFNAHLDNNRCEQALLSNEPSAKVKIVDGVGTSASYLVSGLGYASDIIVTVGAGLVVGVTLCSPLLLLEASSGSAQLSADCFAKIAGPAMEKSFLKIGENTFDKTSSWRCPNLDVISAGLRKVATCYERRGEVEKSISQLKKARFSKEFYECISEKEKLILDSELMRLGFNGSY